MNESSPPERATNNLVTTATKHIRQRGLDLGGRAIELIEDGTEPAEAVRILVEAGAEPANAYRLIELAKAGAEAREHFSGDGNAALADAVFESEDRARKARAKVNAEPEDFDFDVPPEPPRYLVDRFIERQTVNVLSGDMGSAKSIAFMALHTAAATGGDWLGREVSARRLLAIDEENPRAIAHGRLRALGMVGADAEERARLRYFLRQGVTLGDPAWNDWLSEQVEDFRPDLITIDTTGAATNTDQNDQAAVLALYTQALRPLASEFDLAILLGHHERKQQPNQSRARGMAAVGSRQWINQADGHGEMRQRVAVRFTDDEPDANGTRGKRAEFQFAVNKSRSGDVNPTELIVVESRVTEEGALVSMEFRSEGEIEPEITETEKRARALVEAARDHGGEIKRADLCEAAGMESRGGTTGDAIDRAIADGGLEMVPDRRGYYQAKAGIGLAV